MPRPSSPKRPPLPREWYRPTALGFTGYLLSSIAWLPVFGMAAYWTYLTDWPMWQRVLIMAPLIVLAGHGFHMIGWLAHEGVHLSLLRSKYWSMGVACFVGAATTFTALGYGITHWNHHRYTNQESDPDTHIYPRFKRFWPRFLFSRITANSGYTRNTIRVALNLPIDKGYRIPFTDGWTRFFAIFTIISVLFWLGMYGLIAYHRPDYFFIAIILPFLTALPATGLRIYVEHAGTHGGIYTNTRSYISPFWTFVMFGNNMHLEHHIYPTVPAYYLPRVHKFLASSGVYAEHGAHITEGVLAPLAFLGERYHYPEPQEKDLIADPFQMEVATEPSAPESQAASSDDR